MFNFTVNPLASLTLVMRGRDCFMTQERKPCIKDVLLYFQQMNISPCKKTGTGSRDTRQRGGQGQPYSSEQRDIGLSAILRTSVLNLNPRPPLSRSSQTSQTSHPYRENERRMVDHLTLTRSFTSSGAGLSTPASCNASNAASRWACLKR